MSKLKETQINNSYFIQNEFRQKSKAYQPPLPRKKQRVQAKEKNGRVKKYTEEEIFLYKLKHCKIKVDV